MRRALYVGAGLLLALVLLTCTDERVAGPPRPGSLALDLHSLLAAAPGQPPIPLDSIRVTLRRPSEAAYAFDQTIAVRADTLGGDSLVLRLDVTLQQTTEDFQLDVTVYGANVVWYTAAATVRITAGAAAQPAALLARYVGPGANAARVQVLPGDTTVLGGTSFVVHAVAYDSGGAPITGVPVGYRLGDSTYGTLVPALLTATYTAPAASRDSVWVVAETPTHLKDSTRIHVSPPAASLQKVSGDLQNGVVGGALPQGLVVRVRDALGGPFKGASVTWAVTGGSAALSATSSVTDDSGLAAVTVTQLVLGSLTVQASAAGLSGSPVTFGATVLSGSIHQVIISPKLDTIARGATLQYTATLKDSLGNTVNGTVTWSSTVPTIATVSGTGLAAAVAGDSTLVVAAAGGYADTARLYVRALRTVTVSPGDTVVTAISDTFTLHSTAYDNFGAVLTGGFVTRYTSASPTVVGVGAAGGLVTAVGAGNGVVVVRDSVDPQLVVQAAATVRVNQVAAAIVNNPKDTLLVGVNGHGQIVATALDAKGYAIAGRTFGWRTVDPVVATVDQSGVVTGLTLGGLTFAVDTLVEAGKVLRDSTLVAVVASPPALIQWGFDSVAVGDGGNVSVALSLTRPPAAAPLVVSLTASDTTIARPQTRTVTIPAGSAGASVVINGLAAGRAVLVASDSAGSGYQPDTMVVTVVSTIQFQEVGQFTRQSAFYVNQNETHRAQVWLSDPAPAGGLGVTFVYGKPGTSAVAPAPAIIPAGQLSADVVIEGLTPGTDSVVPTSGGFVGKFSRVYVAPDSLRLVIPYPHAVGVGQTASPYVAFTYAMDHPLVVSLALAPAIGVVPDTVTIPASASYRYFTLAGTSPGKALVTAAAPGWISGTDTITFTTPQLGAQGTTTMVAGNPSRGYWAAYTEDSISGYTHPVADTVRVSAASRDTTVVAVDSGAGKVVPGSNSVSVTNTLRAQPAAGGRSTFIVLTAPGYRPDSFLVSVQAPALTFQLSYPYQAGVGTKFANAGYVQIPYARADSFTVLFQHSRRGIVSGPDSVTIPKGQTTAYFDIVTDSLGVDTITVTRATGYTLPAAQAFRVVPLHVAIYSQPATLYTISRPQRVAVFARQDSSPFYANPLVAPLRVSLASSNTAAFTLDSAAVTIPAGGFVSNYDTLRVSPTSPGNDSGRVLIRATGSSNDSSNIIRVLPTPLTLNVSYPGQAGYGLSLGNSTVSLPDVAPDTVHVTLRHLLAGDSLNPASVTIPPGSATSGSFDVRSRDSTGVDTITASATGYLASSKPVTLVPAQVDVSDIGSSHLTTEPPYRVPTYTRTRPSPFYMQNAIDTVRFNIVSTDSSVMVIDSADTRSAGEGSGTAFVAPGTYYGYFRVRFVGSGTARMVVSAPGFGTDTMAPVTVTGPSLHLAYQNLTVGVGQLFPTQYVYVDNAVTGQPLVVKLARSDSTLPAGSQAFLLSADSVVIAVGQTFSPVFSLTGQVIGSAQLIARASGYAEARTTVSVGQPRLVGPATLSLSVGETPRNVTVYTADQNGSIRYVAAPLAVRDSSTDTTVVAPDSATVTIGTNLYSAAFPLRGKARGTAAVVFQAPGYTPDTMLVTVDTAQLYFGAAPSLGPGQTALLYVSLPFVNDSAVTVDLSTSVPGIISLPASAVIPPGAEAVTLTVTGVALGTTTVTASAPGVAKPATVDITVGPPRLQVLLGAATSAGQKTTLTVYAEDSTGTVHTLAAPLAVTLVSSDPAHTTFDSATITIAAGAYSAATGVIFTTTGSYTVTATAVGYAAGSDSTVTSGALVLIGDSFFSPQTVTVGTGQQVLWSWTGTLQHGVQWLTGPAQPPNSPTQATGTYAWTFTTPGTYSYQCTVHGAVMTGTVVVQ